MGSGGRWRLAMVAGGACALGVACGGALAPEAGPAADAGLEGASPSTPAPDAMSPTDAGEAPAPRDASQPEVQGPPCSHSEWTCPLANECLVDLVYGLDTGETSPGVQLFLQQKDAVAYVRSLGFQGALTGDEVEFTAGGDPYVFAMISLERFAVVDGAVAPDVYGAVTRYVICTQPQDAQAD